MFVRGVQSTRSAEKVHITNGLLLSVDSPLKKSPQDVSEAIVVDKQPDPVNPSPTSTSPGLSPPPPISSRYTI
ncbi:hypothetical protein GUJ93_ZPchr0012g21139 [Zizania palustris]|uniref:Uncharacterized protein n=1 Tax=Zizania palustris TaxID=103762 RepID=A0A8J5WNY9_ZIZPA|nr:hypothetical protein GUJ93_ZPchr0012g21139 [Zizania palustris]